MKLNNKNTFIVGLAFLSICAFWQMYDNIIPLILTNTFHMNETYSGAIMAADNILALFLLPFFGSLSDKADTKIGKRMPFILFGTGCAIVLMNVLPILDN
ncbi:MAG: MFS transporter, partial [Erysipelotrichaceae bacterium]|nr:MFS transporter [Erysipelotrichaceae bacterium]